MDYITAVANLKAQMFGIPSNRDASYIKKLAMSIDVPVFTPKSGVRIEVNDSELGNNSGETTSKYSFSEFSQLIYYKLLKIWMEVFQLQKQFK